jgi:hypothetical protein
MADECACSCFFLPEAQYEENLIILDALRKGERVTEVSDSLQSVFHPSVQPFLRSWMDYNPVEVMKSLTVPVKDAELLKDANPQAELIVLNNMNHVLKKAPEDREENLKTYNDPSLPLAEGLVKSIIEFLKDNGFK